METPDMLSKNDLACMAARINQGMNFEYPNTVDLTLFSGRYYGKVYSKGRPRFSGNGHAFTPPNTRKFEKAVSEFYHAEGAVIAHCPVSVYVVLFDKLPKSIKKAGHVLAAQSLIYSSVGDLDNRAKGILDAGNGVLFGDDGQIIVLNIRRCYHEKEGFSIEVYRSGLSEAEALNIERFLK